MTDKDLKQYPYLCSYIHRLKKELSNDRTSDLQQLQSKKKLLKSALLGKCEIELFIEGTDDVAIREILTFRYLYGETWDEVASHFGYAESKDSVRMKASRYLRKTSQVH